MSEVEQHAMLEAVIRAQRKIIVAQDKFCESLRAKLADCEHWGCCVEVESLKAQLGQARVALNLLTAAVEAPQWSNAAVVEMARLGKEPYPEWAPGAKGLWLALSAARLDGAGQ